jgi:beta-barrel assembly-enhancing protease
VAALFDGVSSDPRQVQVAAAESGFLLDGALVEWSRIQNIHKSALRYQIEFDGKQMILLEDLALGEALRNSWVGHRGGIQEKIHRFTSLRLRTQILWGLAVGGSFVALLYLAFVNVYRLVPLQYDHYMGNKVDAQVRDFFEPCTTEALVEFHQKALQVLRKPGDRFEPRITIINDPMVNAFALPGGHIYVFRGILEESENPDEILGVIAHELAHAEMRHGVQQLGRTLGITFIASMLIGADVEGMDMVQNAETMSEIGSTLLVLKYSRGFEREADLEGLHRMRAANLPTLGMGQLLVRIETKFGKGMDTSSLAWLSTHPKSWERMERYRKELAKVPDPTTPNPLFAGERKIWNLLKNSCPEPRNWKERLNLPWD